MDRRGQRVIFFDMRNTLGIVDKPGHLIKFRPSTDFLLEMVRQHLDVSVGIITNVPAGVDARQMLDEAGILPFLHPDGIISTQDPDIQAVQGAKPGPAIYQAAARRLGVPVENCLYVGENLVEQLGAWAAGMSMGHKEFPPSGDFMREAIARGAVLPQSSGRLSEYLLEEDHLVGKRIVECAVKIKEYIGAGTPLSDLLAPMGRLVWLTKHFVDAYHHRKEEEVLIPFGLLRGLKPADVSWALLEHDQGRAYFRAMEIALLRLQGGDEAAAHEMAALCSAFADLYKAHGRKEDDSLFQQIGSVLTDADDVLIVGLLQRIGPADLTLYIDMIAATEHELVL